MQRSILRLSLAGKLKYWIVCVPLITSLYAQDTVSEFKLSFIEESMDYREYENGTLLDSEQSSFGDLYGINVVYSYFLKIAEEDFSQIELCYTSMKGETAYRGSLLGSDKGYGSIKSTSKASIVDAALRYSYHYELSHDFDLFGGVGFGYRSWTRTLSASQEEIYKWYSLRPFIGFEYALTSLWSLEFNGEYQYGINPVMEYVGGVQDFNLGGADIMQLGGTINYAITPSFVIFFQGIWEVQEIKKSDVHNELIGGTYKPVLEPDSTAHNEYILFGLKLRY